MSPSPEPEGPEAHSTPQTGDPLVDAALGRLADAAASPDTDLDAHLAAGERVHEALAARLADVGDG